jgi:hypothetical protein
MNAVRRGKTNFSGTHPDTTTLTPELNLHLDTEIDCVKDSTPRFEIELPKGIECCCLFDGSMVRTLYLSPRQAGSGTLSRIVEDYRQDATFRKRNGSANYSCALPSKNDTPLGRHWR